MQSLAKYAHAAKASKGVSGSTVGNGASFRGSMEGFHSARRADIQMNGRGYNVAKNAPSKRTTVPKMKGLGTSGASSPPRNYDSRNKIPRRSPLPGQY